MQIKSYPLLKLVAFLSIFIFANSAKAQYCPQNTYYGCSDGDYIESFSTTGGISNINNINSGCPSSYSGYDYYPAPGQLLKAIVGDVINFTVVANPNWDEYYQIWIDYNQDNDFADAGESVWMGQVIFYGYSATGSFTIPATALPGMTRLRVRSAYGATSPIDPCALYYYTEIEDYDVQIKSGPCDTVQNLKASNVTLTTADVNFDPPLNGATQYEVKFDQNPAPPAAGIGWGVTNNTSFSYQGLQPGTCYYVHVRANCDTNLYQSDMSGWSTVEFCTIADCVQPSVLVDEVKSTTARAAWEPVPGAYEYEYAVSLSDVPPSSGTVTNYTSVIMQGLAPNKALYVHVRARCTPTPISTWRSVPFHTFATTDIEYVSKDGFNVEAYPNPVQDVLNIKVSKAEGKADLVLTDITGKEVYTGKMDTEEAQIDTKLLSKGVYMLKYADGAHLNMIKIVKQ